MKRNILHLTMATAASVAALICIMALMTSESFASTFTFKDVPQGKSYDAFFGEINDYDVTAYYKIKPTKKGYITFTADYSGYVALCNSKKKVISKGSSTGDYLSGNSDYPWQRSVSYGVAKGKTYYVRVKGMPVYDSTDANYWARVKWNNSKVSPSKCGSSKAKAKAVKRKKTVKGLFVAGSKKAQWFKITNKQKTTKIYINSKKNDDAVKFKIYYKSFNKWYDTTYTLMRSDDYYKNTITGTISKKIKHTYYIKVYPDAKTSGYYTIKWK